MELIHQRIQNNSLFAQENQVPCPDSPASTVKSVKSEKSLLLNVVEEGDKYKVFNVSGTLFVIDTTIFQNYPDTLLGEEKRGYFTTSVYSSKIPVFNL